MWCGVWEKGKLSVIELLSRQNKRPKTVWTNFTSNYKVKFFVSNPRKHNPRLDIGARDLHSFQNKAS